MILLDLFAESKNLDFLPLEKFNRERIMKKNKNLLLFAALAVVIVLVLAFGFFYLQEIQQSPAPDYFPMQDWKTSTPEEQGWDSAVSVSWQT